MSGTTQRAVLIRAALRGSTSLPIRSLRGFDKRKGHAVPTSADDRTSRWVGELAEAEVREGIDSMFAQIQQEFGFKRREVTVTLDGGDGSILTPDFGYGVAASQSADAPANALLTRVLEDITDLQLLESEAFQTVFGPWFDHVELHLSDALDIEAIIDQIEEDDDTPVQRQYPVDCSHCTLWVQGEPWCVRLQGQSLTIHFDKKVTPRVLLAGYMACLGSLRTSPSLARALPTGTP